MIGGGLLTKILGGLAGVMAFVALIFKSKADRAEAKRQRQAASIAKAAQKTQQKAGESLVKGLEKEQEVRDEKVDTTRRDHFS